MYDNEFIVIYGVDHTKTGKATYCSAAVYGEIYFNGVAGSSSMQKIWEKSAEPYLDGDPEADKFFVLNAFRPNDIFTGGPTGLNKIFNQNNSIVVPTSIKTQGIHKYTPLFIGFRNYLETVTQSGPIPEEMISPRVIKFSKPADAKIVIAEL